MTVRAASGGGGGGGRRLAKDFEILTNPAENMIRINMTKDTVVKRLFNQTNSYLNLSVKVK